MQHLLDFVQEHMISDQLCIRVDSGAGEIEVLQRRQPDRDSAWYVRVIPSADAAVRVPHTQLLATLQAQGVDMLAFERELHALLATQVTFAELVLRDAAQLLSAERNASAHEAQRELLGILWLSLQELEQAEPERPALRAISGEAGETPARAGHLSLVT